MSRNHRIALHRQPLLLCGQCPRITPGEPQARSLFDIQLADPSFETGHFLSGARTAYEIILKAFASGDRASLKPLLSDEVYKAFDSEIAARGAAPAQETLAGLTDARIVEAALAGQTAEI